MAKKTKDTNPEEQARRDVTKSRLKLEAAQEKFAQERVRGQQEVERARLRAAKWLAKASQRVERRAEDLAEAEARALSLGVSDETTVSSPEATVERLDELEQAHAEQATTDNGLVAAQSIENVSADISAPASQ